MASERTPGNEADLLSALRETRDATDLDWLLKRYLPLAHRLAEKFRDSGACPEGVTQVAKSGLYKALLEYDSAQDEDLIALTIPVIVGNIRGLLKERWGESRRQRQLESHKAAVDRSVKTIILNVGRPPTVAELARSTGLSVEQVCDTFESIEAEESKSKMGSDSTSVTGNRPSLQGDQVRGEPAVRQSPKKAPILI